MLMGLDEGLGELTVLEVFRFQYQKGLRENAITWLLANYIVIINQEVVMKGRKIQLSELVGMLRYAKTRVSREAVLDVGAIPL